LGAWQPVVIGSILVLVLLVVAGAIEKHFIKPELKDEA
jgi:hypothetical protein